MPAFDAGLFGSAIATKYANQSRDSMSEAALRGDQGFAAVTDANANANLSGANARRVNAETAQVGDNAAAQRELEFQQGQSALRDSTAQSGLLTTQTKNLGAMLPGQLGAQDAASREADARTAGLGLQNTHQQAINTGYADDALGQLHDLLGNNMGGAPNIVQQLQQLLQGGKAQPAAAGNSLSDTNGGNVAFAHGTAAVAPGKEDQGVDTVDAKLRPHEAVLVPGAADAIGRDKIAALNAIHNAKDPKLQAAQKPQGKGMPKPKGKGGKPGFADGSPNVPGLNAGGSLQGAQGPGTTVTSGTWGQATPNQDLRAQMAGKTVTKNYAEGTHDVGNDAAGTPAMSPGMLQQIMASMTPGAGASMGKTGGKPKMGGGMPKPKAKKVA